MLSNYKQIDLSAWTMVGEGGNGTTYTNPSQPDVILKLSHLEDGTSEAVSKEFYTSKAVYELGIPTPRMIEIVKNGDEYGTLSQLIAKKKSLGRLCGEQPADIDRLAERTAALAKQLHGTIVPDTPWLPSMKQLMLTALAQTKMLSGSKLKQVTAFVEGLDDAPTLLHGDLTMGNLIFDLTDDSPYWIDLGRATHGLPMFDLGHMYLFCNIFSKKERVQQIAHMTGEQMVQFWKRFAIAYNGREGIEAFTAECKRFAALDVILLGHIQTLTWHERFFLGLLAKSMFK